MSKFSKLVQKQKENKAAKKHRFNLEAITNANREIVMCPCGSHQTYKNCCAKIHQDITKAENPIDLMRSRYTAFVFSDVDYLLKSHHTSTRPVAEAKEIQEWSSSVVWEKLEVLNEELVNKTLGYVTFKAHFVEDGKETMIYERSRFVKEDKYWTYIDGQHVS